MKTIVFGAGSIGRGLLGQLFSGPGREVVFAEVNLKLIRQLNARREYVLRLVWYDQATECIVGPVRAISMHHMEQVTAELLDADLAATAVGAANLLGVVPAMASGIEARARAGLNRHFNVLFCENMRNAPEIFRHALWSQLGPTGRRYVREHVGLVAGVVNRIVPGSASQDATDLTTVMAEPGKELCVDATAFRGPLPGIVGLLPITSLRRELDRKLFLHNTSHALVAYLGCHQGHQYIDQAVSDPGILDIASEAIDESAQGLAYRYETDVQSQRDYGREFLEHLANPTLLDPVTRVARDPLRKLAADGRLVTPARWAVRRGIEPRALSWGIAGALAYDHPRDEAALRLQCMLQRNGVDRALREVCGIEAQSQLGRLVVARYRSLKARRALGHLNDDR